MRLLRGMDCILILVDFSLERSKKNQRTKVVVERWHVKPRVCRSVHLHTFKWINQLDAAINYRFIACRLNTTLHVSGILMAINRTDHDQQHCYHHVPTVNQRLLLQLIGSWWWARGCPKHAQRYLNDKQQTCNQFLHLVGWFIWMCEDVRTYKP